MKRNALFMLSAALMFLLSCDKPQKKVLLVFSYHADFEWVMEEMAGVEQVLDDETYDIESFFMDTKRHNSAEYMKETTASVMQKIDEMVPDLVMLFDDNAARLVGAELAGRDVPVVFCGVNGDPLKYWDKAPNITGVLEREYTEQAFNVVKTLVPDIQSAAIFLDESPTSESMLNIMYEGPEIPEVKYIVKTNDYAVWQEQIMAMQDSVDCIGIFAFFTLKDSSGNTVESLDVINWTLANNMLPEFAILDITINEGVLCGAVETGTIQGISAAKIAKRIFEGEMPADIAFEVHDKGEVFINKNRAAALGITIPEGLSEGIVFVE